MTDNLSETSKEVDADRAIKSSANVVMYATRFCPYCMFARRLFKSKGVEFTEISVSNGDKFWDEMQQKSGGNTVPQILINDEPLGGYDDIAALDSKGELDQKLGI